MSEEIVIPIFNFGSGLGPENCASIQLNYTLAGGTFSISILKDIALPPSENAQFSLPFGRIGVVKSVGRGYSGGGILDVVSGSILPPLATLPTLVGIPTNVFALASQLAQQIGFGFAVSWETFNPTIKAFIFKGFALAGIQQLASFVSAEVVVRGDGVHVTVPGKIIGGSFQVQKADIVSANQIIDYSQDYASILNPALSLVQFTPEGEFVYDGAHAQKQPKTTVQAGAPHSQGSTDFIPIPDGWLVDGSFEEWTPPSPTNLANPSPSVGRYWKEFPSPTNPGMRRGITSFTRMIKQINIPGNVSSFVGSPVSGDTDPNSLGTFTLQNNGSESGIYGFDSGGSGVGVTFFDVISNQFYTFNNAIALTPTGGGASGDASIQTYSITMELWTFPRVNPQIFPVGNPVNPFNVPKDALVVNPPMGNIVSQNAGILSQYFNAFMTNYRLINSPRLRTTISVVWRGYTPQVGDGLFVVAGLQYNNCGRISSVSQSMSRSGLVLNITAEVYRYVPGLSGKYPALFVQH